MDRIQRRRPASSATKCPPTRMERRATLRETIAKGMPDLEKAVAKYDLDEYYGKALGPGHLRPGARTPST